MDRLIDKYGLKSIIKISQGNHDCNDSESEQTEKDIEDWMPSLKETPEVNPNDKSWEPTKWIHAWQDRNAFFISMNLKTMILVSKGTNTIGW